MNARIPADVDMADRIFAGLTARQLAILGIHAMVLWALWAAIGRLNLYVFGAIAVPVAVVGFVWATVKIDGTTFERLAAAGFGFLRTPRRRVFAPEGLPAIPRWTPRRAVQVAPLELPIARLATDGCIDLGPDGAVVACRASCLNLALRSESEQQALVDAFGRFMNALDESVQFLIRSDRVDLTAVLEAMEQRARALPHPALEQAALDHAEFLRLLASRRDVLTRQVFVCFRDERPAHEAAGRLAHRVEEATTFLRGMGVRLKRLESDDAAHLIARACDPEGPQGRATQDRDAVIEGRC